MNEWRMEGRTDVFVLCERWKNDDVKKGNKMGHARATKKEK